MCIWLGTNLPQKTPETIKKSSLEELGRCLDDRLTLSDKELHAVAYGCDIETEGHDLKKLGKNNRGKLALFNLKDSHFIGVWRTPPRKISQRKIPPRQIPPW